MLEDGLGDPTWAGRAPGHHAAPPEDLAGEPMHSYVQGLWIDQGRGVKDEWEGELLREYVTGEE